MRDDQPVPPAEDSTSPRAVLLAFGVLALIAAAVFYFNPHKVASVTVPAVRVFAPHTEFGALQTKEKPRAGMHVYGQSGLGAGAEDDLYVAVTVRVDNKLRLPIFVTSTSATLTTANNEEVPAAYVAPHDIPRIEETFPALAPMLPHPIADGEEAAPKSSMEGQVLLLFPNLNEQAWRTKKSATLTLGLAHQDPLTVTLP